MRFYNEQHKFYAGIDLHARQMYVCILNSTGETVFHKNMPTDPARLERALKPFSPDIVIGVECIFTWYWLSDFCQERGIPFALGHALYMKAIHGGKTKTDKIDSFKIASMLRGGMFPLAYEYPKEMRSTRDLLRRRSYFVRQHASLLAHVNNTNTQYNLEPFSGALHVAKNRIGVDQRFEDNSTQLMVAADLELLDEYHRVIVKIESQLKRSALLHDSHAFHLLKSIPGVGPILGLTMLYEIQDISRFPKVGNFISYSRLVKCAHESAGKKMNGGHNKIGNAHLKWAFSEAAVLLLREEDRAKKLFQRLSAKYGRAKALSIIAQKLGRLVYFMLKKKMPYNADIFFGDSVCEPGA